MGKFLFLFRRAPEREHVPDDAVVAVPREEGDGRLPLLSPSRATTRHEVAPHREAAEQQDLAVRLAQITLERASPSDAGDDGSQTHSGSLWVPTVPNAAKLFSFG